MEKEVRRLIAIYGFKKVYIAMENEINELYIYLKQISEKSVKFYKKPLTLSIDMPGEIEEQKEILPKVFDKKEHLLQIEKKNKENKENGIDPYSLLTKENLEHWIKEGKSYMRIAREYVGLSDTIIRESARKFNLKSAISQLISQKRG